MRHRKPLQRSVLNPHSTTTAAPKMSRPSRALGDENQLAPRAREKKRARQSTCTVSMRREASSKRVQAGHDSTEAGRLTDTCGWFVRAVPPAAVALARLFCTALPCARFLALPRVLSHAKTGGKAKNLVQGKGFRNRSRSVILLQCKNSTLLLAPPTSYP